MTSVYQYIDRNGVVLYIGCTNNLRVRNSAHKSKIWYKDVHTIKSQIFDSRTNAASHELVLIRTLKPIHNKNIYSRACVVYENESARNAAQIESAEYIITHSTRSKGMIESAVWALNRFYKMGLYDDNQGILSSALAYHLGVTVDTVRKYEQGQRSPSSRIAAILSELKGSTDGPAND